MVNDLIVDDILFTVRDVFGRTVRTTKRYWKKIKEEKHAELTAEPNDVINALTNPDEVYRSVQDPYIVLYYKKVEDGYLVALAKFVGEMGFVVTCYQTTKTKRKGEKLWP